MRTADALPFVRAPAGPNIDNLARTVPSWGCRRKTLASKPLTLNALASAGSPMHASGRRTGNF
ncbi:MAG TPA: hypothetical protein VH639_21635 [Bryobacteraceae bacterium]